MSITLNDTQIEKLRADGYIKLHNGQLIKLTEDAHDKHNYQQ